LRKLRDRASRGDLRSAKIRVEPSVANHLKTEKWNAVQDAEQRFNVRIDIVTEHSFLPGQDDFTFETDPNAKPVPLEEPNFGPAPRFEGDPPAPLPDGGSVEGDLSRFDHEERDEEDEDEAGDEDRGSRRDRD